MTPKARVFHTPNTTQHNTTYQVPDALRYRASPKKDAAIVEEADGPPQEGALTLELLRLIVELLHVHVAPVGALVLPGGELALCVQRPLRFAR